MNTSKRLMATFRPHQAWVDDYTVDTNGVVEFDATKSFLSLTLEKIKSFKHNDYDSDNLSDDLPERLQHGGPFEVEVNVDEWLEKQGFPDRQTLTAANLHSLRYAFGVVNNSVDEMVVTTREQRLVESTEEILAALKRLTNAFDARNTLHAQEPLLGALKLMLTAVDTASAERGEPTGSWSSTSPAGQAEAVICYVEDRLWPC